MCPGMEHQLSQRKLIVPIICRLSLARPQGEERTCYHCLANPTWWAPPHLLIAWLLLIKLYKRTLNVHLRWGAGFRSHRLEVSCERKQRASSRNTISALPVPKVFSLHTCCWFLIWRRQDEKEKSRESVCRIKNGVQQKLPPKCCVPIWKHGNPSFQFSIQLDNDDDGDDIESSQMLRTSWPTQICNLFRLV